MGTPCAGFPLLWKSYKLLGTGQGREDAADAHPVLALTWSEDMAAGHAQIQKLFF